MTTESVLVSQTTESVAVRVEELRVSSDEGSDGYCMVRSWIMGRSTEAIPFNGELLPNSPRMS
jgi:hypothetical protein